VADVSVRPARSEDAAEIGRIQLETWRTAYATLLPAEALAGLDAADAVEAWRASIVAPPSSRHHVLVAQEQDWLVGFAAVGPATDLEATDADPARIAGVTALLVEPRWGRRGHGSRLLAAAVDHWRGDGFGTAIVWVPEDDQASAAFYTGAGWARDGYVRALDTGPGTLREVRLHTLLDET
jgi:GNAT superfamily N-acetyltransferase